MMERTPDHERSDLGINNTNCTSSHHVTLPGLNNTSQAPNNQQSSLLQNQVDGRPAVLDKSLRCGLVTSISTHISIDILV